MIAAIRQRLLQALATSLGLALLGAAVAGPAGGPGEEASRVARWRAERLASLTSETGWLTPIALYWLKQGENSVGRSPGCDLSLDDAVLAPDTGSFVLSDGQVRYIAHAPTLMTHLGKPVTSLELVSDAHEQPTELLAGALHFMLIERSGHLGIRVRDAVAPARRSFKGLEYFPIRPEWRIAARFEPYVPARNIPIVNILGMQEEMSSPGAIVFERDGRTWRLDALLEAPGDRELFVMFSDATSGKQTYGAGRFLYVELPEGNRVDIDFNEAYNPPCAFTDFATCPLPPPQNRLSLAIEAGELNYERTHPGH